VNKEIRGRIRLERKRKILTKKEGNIGVLI
jgi:hypothetical protein